jgi:predicted GIY-YIG superfamily endonuclease
MVDRADEVSRGAPFGNVPWRSWLRQERDSRTLKCVSVHFVSMLRCSDGSYYVGSPSNPETRAKAHNAGTTGVAYTSLRRPVVLVYSEPHPDRTSAMRRELQIKRWSRAKKEALVAGDSAALKALSKRRGPAEPLPREPRSPTRQASGH